MGVSRAMSGVSGPSCASEDEPPGVVVMDSVNVGNVGKLDQILLRLEKLDKNYGSVHKSIEALSQSVDRLTGHVSHVSKHTARSHVDLEITEKRNSRKSVSPVPVTRVRNSKPGTVQSLVQMQSDFFQEIVMADYISHRRSDDDEGLGPADCDTSRSPRSPRSPKSVVSVIPPAASERGAEMDLPGLLQCRPEHEAKVPNTSTSHAPMHAMNEESQTHILGSTSLCSSLEDDAPLDAGSRLILAFNPMLYLALGIPLICVLSLAVACGGVTCQSGAGLESKVLASLIYGIAATLCVHRMTRALHSKNLKLATGRLHAFVAEFKVDWREVSGQEGCKYLCMWLLVVLIIIVARCLGIWWLLTSEDVSWAWTHVLPASLEICSLLVYALSSGLLTAAAYTQSYLLLGLDKSLDCWCSHLMAMPEFEEGVRTWNVLQALLKYVGRELAGSFLIFQGFGYLCFIFFLVSGIVLIFSNDFEALPLMMEVLSGVPLLFLSCLSLRLSAHGAALTEKCLAIPSFVNQIPSKLIDQERQYLVRFIEDSSAGFFVRNVKLTQEMVMKQVYIVGALLSATFSALSRLLV